MGMIETMRALAQGAETVREVHDKDPKGPGITTIDAHCRSAVALGFLKRQAYETGDGLGDMAEVRKGRDDLRGRPPVRYTVTAKGRAFLKSPGEAYARQDPRKAKAAALAARKPKRKASTKRKIEKAAGRSKTSASAKSKALKAARDKRYRERKALAAKAAA